VSKRNDPLLHLARGLEEFLLAAAESLRAWRGLLEDEASGLPQGGLRELLETLCKFAGLEGLVSASLLRAALRQERARWATRAKHDPAARRLCDLCSALLEVMGEEKSPTNGRDNGSMQAKRGP
jgi:hypothetical protein